MGALAKENHIELFVSAEAFDQRVGMIRNYWELKWLGFELSNFAGMFTEDELPDLQGFIHENPEYHIVTNVSSGRYVNKYVPQNRLYFLANGDRNPCLVLNHLIDPMAPLIHEDMVRETLAVLKNIKNRDQG